MGRYNIPWQLRFAAKVQRKEGCWEWLGTIHPNGYAYFCKAGKQYLAHRLAWELAKGEIPSGLDVCHRCDNPKCCRPDHLFLGTHQDNMSDMKEKGRAFRMLGEDHIGHKLSVSEVLKIRKLRQAKTPVKDLAKQFGVSLSLIEKIIYRDLWKHLPEAA